MNEKIQIIIATFISFFSILCSLIFTTIIGKNRHRTDSDVGTGIEQARKTCESAKGTTEQLANSIEHGKQILAELKKRHPDK